MADAAVTTARDERGVVTVTLDRPEVRNAFDAAIIEELRTTLEHLHDDPDVRVLVLTGAGTVFSAGANIDWLRSMVDYSYEENVEDSRRLDALYRTLDGFRRPVVARVNGAALGGALGLIACADIAVAVRDARFGFTEVKLGIAPAVISTYVLPVIGAAAARRYFLTGERFGAERAAQLGLVHEVCAPDELDAQVARVVDELLTAGPDAQAAVKQLVRDVVEVLPDQQAAADRTVPLIARLRVAEEGQAGMSAFLAKQRPPWVPDQG